MTRSLPRRLFNRVLHWLARTLPGGRNLRPALHRLRGVKIRGKVWIGDDVYLDNEHPDCIEINEHAVISLKSIILGHTKGRGRVIIERDAFIGPLAVVACTGNKEIHIGEGAVISAGAIVTSSVPAHAIIGSPRVGAVGRSMVPYWDSTYEEFMGGLEPLRRPNRPPNQSGKETI
jgi:serine acetyltransferase